MQRNPIGWFEIPVEDMDRAKKFYQDVLEYQIEVHEMGKILMGWFPMKSGAEGATGSLVKGEGYKPSHHGCKIYFTSPSGDLKNELQKVESAGGKIIAPKFSIGEHGNVGVIEDTEGNLIYLHSMN
ncbi:VOC family protein [Candidatus Peregrinibacteria bacterium]|nr:VOC family protein [Candidatus Peregrinibacteria bacterium]